MQSKAIMQREAAQLQTVLSRKLLAKYKETTRDLNKNPTATKLAAEGAARKEYGTKPGNDKYYMHFVDVEGYKQTKLGDELRKVVQEEVNQYLGKVGLPCRIDLDILDLIGGLKVKEARAKELLGLGELKEGQKQGDIDAAAEKVVKACHEMFSSIHPMLLYGDNPEKRYNSARENWTITKCVLGVMKSLAKFVVGAALFMGAYQAGISVAGGTALAVGGALTIPPLGAAAVCALTLVAGAYTMKEVVQDLFLGREYIDRDYEKHHIPGRLSNLSSEVQAWWHGVDRLDLAIVEDVSKAIAVGSKEGESIAVKVATSLQEYCSKFEQQQGKGGRE